MCVEVEHMEGEQVCGESEKGVALGQLWRSLNLTLWGRRMGTRVITFITSPPPAPLPWMPLLWPVHTCGDTLTFPNISTGFATWVLFFHPLFDFIPMWISSLDIHQVPMIWAILSLFTCSSGVCQPHSNQFSSQTSAPGLAQEEWGRVPGQRYRATGNPPSLCLSCCTGSQHLLCARWHTHIVPNSHKLPRGGNRPADTHGQRFRHYNKPSPLSFRIWFCWSFGFAGLGKPTLSHAGKLDFQSGSLVLDSESRRIFQIGRRTVHLKGKKSLSSLSFSLGLLGKTNHIRHAHY